MRLVSRTGGSSVGLADRAELLGWLAGPILHFLGPYEWAWSSLYNTHAAPLFWEKSTQKEATLHLTNPIVHRRFLPSIRRSHFSRWWYEPSSFCNYIFNAHHSRVEAFYFSPSADKVQPHIIQRKAIKKRNKAQVFLATSQWNKTWQIVSVYSPHLVQVGTNIIPWDLRPFLTAKAPDRSLHMKCLILGDVLVFHRSFRWRKAWFRRRLL